MTLSILKGDFNKNEAIEILTQIIHIKIKYHENKINTSHNIEDIKMREKRITELQKDLFEARKYINQKEKLSLESEITLS